jgi:hypothetical protein
MELYANSIGFITTSQTLPLLTRGSQSPQARKQKHPPPKREKVMPRVPGRTQLDLSQLLKGAFGSPNNSSEKVRINTLYSKLELNAPHH